MIVESMAKVQVKFLSGFKEAVKGESAEVSIVGGSTVEDVLKHLCDKFGEPLRSLIFKNGKSIAGNLIIFVNGRNILTINGVKTVLRDGDQIILSTPVAGG
ncbi:MAG: MoaD family protein [Candidatus Bathyarchaeia archaeon]